MIIENQLLINNILNKIDLLIDNILLTEYMKSINEKSLQKLKPEIIVPIQRFRNLILNKLEFDIDDFNKVNVLNKEYLNSDFKIKDYTNGI